MLEADDSERACIPSKLQLANFCQLRKAEIGPECVKTLDSVLIFKAEWLSGFVV